MPDSETDDDEDDEEDEEDEMNINIGRAVFSGVIGTAVMTAVGLWVGPMMGMPLFSGSAAMAMGSLVGHLAYGGVVGGIYGEASVREASPVAA